MARKATVSYDNLILGSQDTSPPEAPDQPEPVQEIPPPAAVSRRPAPVRAQAQQPTGELLRDVAQQFVVYLHPAAHKTIARYALEQSSHRNKVRPHDIIIEAIEDYFQRHGLQGPVRAKPKAG